MNGNSNTENTQLNLLGDIDIDINVLKSVKDTVKDIDNNTVLKKTNNKKSKVVKSNKPQTITKYLNQNLFFYLCDKILKKWCNLKLEIYNHLLIDCP